MTDYRNISQLWHETAALILNEPKDDVPRQLVREGELWELLTFVDTLPKPERDKLTITLPDRMIPPTRIDAPGIEAMLGYPTRPGFSFKR